MRVVGVRKGAFYKAKLIRGFCHLAIGQVRFPVSPTEHIDPTSVSRKLYLSILDMALKRTIVLLPHTAAISLLSCVAVPLKVFLANFSAANVVCLTLKAVQCTPLPLPSKSTAHLRYMAKARRRCQQSGTGIRSFQRGALHCTFSFSFFHAQYIRCFRLSSGASLFARTTNMELERPLLTVRPKPSVSLAAIGYLVFM